MPKFTITEEASGEFATIEARSGVEALRKAAREYPRRRVDYNMTADEEPTTITWFASLPGHGNTARAEITVPGRTDAGCSFEQVADEPQTKKARKPPATRKERIERALSVLRVEDLPPEQRSYARLAISLASGNVGGTPAEIKEAENWILGGIKKPRSRKL